MQSSTTSTKSNEPARDASIILGDIAPNFDCLTTEGKINFHTWLDGKWAVFFNHPKDFTPVCTTELAQVAKLRGEFDKRGVKLIGLSVDSNESHQKWTKDIEELYNVKLNFPMIADESGDIARLYGMMRPESNLGYLTVRDLFIINPERKIRLRISYPASIGRKFAEILRVIDALQLSEAYMVATPAEWEHGQELIVREDVTDEDAKKMFPKGFRADKPYLRYIKLEDLKSFKGSTFSREAKEVFAKDVSQTGRTDVPTGGPMVKNV